MTEENNKLKKVNVRLEQNEGVKYRQQIEAKNEEIRTLKGKLFEQSSEQGLQLLSALRDGGIDAPSSKSDTNSAKASAENAAKEAMNQSVASEESKSVTTTDTAESWKCQVKELTEKLAFAHETIAIMEEEHQQKLQKLGKGDDVGDENDEDPDDIDVVDNNSEASEPSDKMVDRMISQAQKKLVKQITPIIGEADASQVEAL